MSAEQGTGQGLSAPCKIVRAGWLLPTSGGAAGRLALIVGVVVIGVALIVRQQASAAAGAGEVRLVVPRGRLRAGRTVTVSIVNGSGTRILRSDCLPLERRTARAGVPIIRTHGHLVACPRIGTFQPARSRQQTSVVLYDDLIPGRYRLTLTYKPVPPGSVGTLRGWGARSLRAEITVLAFRPGPMADLSEQRILSIATAAASRAGDRQPTLIQHAESTRFEAERIASGDLVFDYNWSYLIAEKGSFVFNNATRPPGATAPTGSVMTIVIDAKTAKITDAGLSSRYPRLVDLGPVTTDLSR